MLEEVGERTLPLVGPRAEPRQLETPHPLPGPWNMCCAQRFCSRNPFKNVLLRPSGWDLWSNPAIDLYINFEDSSKKVRRSTHLLASYVSSLVYWTCHLQSEVLCVFLWSLLDYLWEEVSYLTWETPEGASSRRIWIFFFYLCVASSLCYINM